MKKIKDLVLRLYGNDVVRYIFFGGCTTLVNLVCFYIFWNICHVNLNIANVISIVVAIIFAYVVNSKYVFQDKCETLKDHIQPFCKFVSARTGRSVISHSIRMYRDTAPFTKNCSAPNNTSSTWKSACVPWSLR